MDWFLYDMDLRHERVKSNFHEVCISNEINEQSKPKNGENDSNK